MDQYPVYNLSETAFLWWCHSFGHKNGDEHVSVELTHGCSRLSSRYTRENILLLRLYRYMSGLVNILLCLCSSGMSHSVDVLDYRRKKCLCVRGLPTMRPNSSRLLELRACGNWFLEWRQSSHLSFVSTFLFYLPLAQTQAVYWYCVLFQLVMCEQLSVTEPFTTHRSMLFVLAYCLNYCITLWLWPILELMP